jgi:hypothetical protein
MTDKEFGAVLDLENAEATLDEIQQMCHKAAKNDLEYLARFILDIEGCVVRYYDAVGIEREERKDNAS